MLISILLTKEFWFMWCLSIIGDVISYLVVHSIMTYRNPIKQSNYSL